MLTFHVTFMTMFLLRCWFHSNYQLKKGDATFYIFDAPLHHWVSGFFSLDDIFVNIIFPFSDNATFIATVKQGDDEFPIQTWSLNPSDVGLKDGVAYISVSDNTCVPVGVTFMGTQLGNGKFNFIWEMKASLKGNDVEMNLTLCSALCLYVSLSVWFTSVSVCEEMIKK